VRSHNLIKRLVTLIAGFTVTTSLAGSPFQPKCTDRIIVFPPKTSDPILAEKMSRIVMADYLKSWSKAVDIEECPLFIPYDLSVEELDYLGSTANFQRDAASMTYRQISKMIDRTAAKYVLAIHFDEKILASPPKDKRWLILESLLYKPSDDEASLILVDHRPIRADLRQITTGRLPYWGRLLSRMTPNSIGLSPSVSPFRPAEFRSKNGRKYDISEFHHHGLLPPIISSTQFTRVEHPDGYDVFDYELSLFPSTRLLFFDQDMMLRGVPNNPESATADVVLTDNRSVRLRVAAGCTYATGQISLFWLLGTTYFAGGLGPCLMHNESTGRHSVNYFDWSSVIQVGHRIFFNKSWFVATEAESVRFGRKIYDDKTISIVSTNHSYVLWGYYVADAEGIFARTWRRIGL
jgi:hypothetical protein